MGSISAAFNPSVRNQQATFSLVTRSRSQVNTLEPTSFNLMSRSFLSLHGPFVEIIINIIEIILNHHHHRIHEIVQHIGITSRLLNELPRLLKHNFCSEIEMVSYQLD